MKSLSFEMKNTLLGVPQGSSLSNLLFAIYMNDFPRVIIHSVPILFVDDDYIMICGNPVDININDAIQKLEGDLRAADFWMESNHAKLDSNKIKFIVFAKNVPELLHQLFNL